MAETESFIERVKREIIKYASLYNQYYVDFEYIIFSEAFTKPYYIVSAKEDNFMHLLGVNSELSPQIFFDKSLNGTLTTDDFNFDKKQQNPKSVKGTVRRKIKAMQSIIGIFDNTAYVEENFAKNNIICSFAASETTCTIGFTIGEFVKPKTLLKGNELNSESCKPIDVVLKRQAGSELFDTLTYGTSESCEKYRSYITELSTKELIEKIF